MTPGYSGTPLARKLGIKPGTKLVVVGDVPKEYKSWLAPLDRAALLAVVKHAGRVLIVHEDSRTGGIGESLAAIIQEEAFEWLDAPIRILGALDTPVPYSPPLEAAFLPSEADIEKAARLLVRY